MVGEAIINATAFVGGRYLAKYFTGDHNKADEDKKQHDLVVEKYQVPYKKYQASWLDRHKWQNGDHNKADEDKKQHDLVVEKYQVPYKKYQASWLDCHKWQNQRAVELLWDISGDLILTLNLLILFIKQIVFSFVMTNSGEGRKTISMHWQLVILKAGTKMLTLWLHTILLKLVKLFS